MFAVIHPDSPNYGDVLSRHRTREAAEQAIADERARFTRTRHGKNGAYLEREIAECEPSDTRVRRQRSVSVDSQAEAMRDAGTS